MLPIVYGIIWTDKALGHLSLNKPCEQSAIAGAKQMHEKGGDKITGLRAVKITSENQLVTLWQA